MTDELAFPGTDDGRTVAEFDAEIKAHNAQVAAPAGYSNQTAVQWIQSHQGSYASASIYPNEVNGTVPFWLEAPAAPVPTVRCAPERDAEDELHCAEGVLDALAIDLAMPETAFDCLGGYITAVVDAIRAAPADPVARPLAGLISRASMVLKPSAGHEVTFRFDDLEDATRMRLWAESRVAQVAAPAAPVATSDWRTPTTYAQRFTDAVALLCGRAPSEEAVTAWLTHEGDELQGFCAEHGPAWAQGIVLLDAAALLADTPAEGADHAPAPAEPVARPLVESVINAARAAMDESTEAYDADMSIKIPSHLAASLSLCLDEYDRAHGIGQGDAS